MKAELPGFKEQVASISQIPVLSYAWIYADQSPKLPRSYRILGTVKEYQLIQVIPLDRCKVTIAKKD
ncbi:hypothetical protein [Nostoc sp. DedQUE09]|uniref:hypothetical protein n=1 Tax=Nostoc sp. DedQUE09 TaxID=3075394 RepID=UPI002AD4BF25|nr:hypothetical protein [Nostoc sp. DedQUE09]MDZ7954188.1 hypothetical protein [Nostoc sp. DedQUE09]